MGANLAPDATELSNADRVKLASLALDAKALPVREVTAVIYAYADPSERNPIHLVERRVRGVKDYLIQLGVSPQKIEVDQRVRRSRRDEGVEDEALMVEFVPQCPPQGCDSLCSMPTK